MLVDSVVSAVIVVTRAIVVIVVTRAIVVIVVIQDTADSVATVANRDTADSVANRVSVDTRDIAVSAVFRVFQHRVVYIGLMTTKATFPVTILGHKL